MIKRELLLDDIFFSLTNIVKDAIIVTDSYRNVVYWNRAAERIFGFKDSEIIGQSVDTVLPHIIISSDEQADMESRKKFFEAIGIKKDSKKIPLEVSVTMWESEKGSFITLIARDIADRKNTEEKLRYLSFHDNLTGLYNRSYFDEELQRLNTTRQLPLSIIIGDIDGFKLVNDAFGYKEGDELLRKLSRILKDSCRSEDILARWGGDEFVILLPGTDIQGVNEIISRIGNKSKALDTGEIPLNISLGYATKDSPDQSIDTVIKEAENSMKQKKLVQSKKVSNSIIASIEKRFHEKHPYLLEDSERIKKLAAEFGRSIKLSRSDLEDLALLAEFYDIGKVAIKTNILTKKTKLAENEWQVMRMHPEIGYRIAKASTRLAQISDAILYHHENWDGSGYPYHLKGNRIPLISRIIAVVIAYDVMAHGRSYKKATGMEKALEELKNNSGIQFDPQIVSKFIEMMQKKEENLSLFS